MSEAVTIEYDSYQYLTTADFAAALRFALTNRLEPTQIDVLLAELQTVLANTTGRPE